MLPSNKKKKRKKLNELLPPPTSIEKSGASKYILIIISKLEKKWKRCESTIKMASPKRSKKTEPDVLSAPENNRFQSQINNGEDDDGGNETSEK